MPQDEQRDLLESIRLFDFMLYHMHRVHVKEADRGHLQVILGLSVRQLDSLRALNYLLGDNRTEGIPLKRLAQQMWMSEPAASLLVDKMVKKGFFIRTENPKDRRSVCIRLSEEGEANYKMLADGLRVRWQNLFSRLPEEDVENFQRIIHRLHDEFHTEL